MVSRASAEWEGSGEPEASDQAEQADPPDAAAGFDAIPDSLRYIADMLAELRLIADRSGWRLLAAFLGLAYAEACAQHDRLAPRSAR